MAAIINKYKVILHYHIAGDRPKHKILGGDHEFTSLEEANECAQRLSERCGYRPALILDSEGNIVAAWEGDIEQ